MWNSSPRPQQRWPPPPLTLATTCSRALVTRNAATNVFLAPSSISEALTQLSMGGSEQAQRQLYRALRYHSLQDPQFQNTLRDLLTSIKGPTKGLKTAARIYLARNLRDINDWVKQQTANGVVRFLTKSLSRMAGVHLVGVGYFKGKVDGGAPVRVPMMHQDNYPMKLGIDSDLGCTIGQIQMEGDVSMFVFLPNDVTNNMTLVEESLTGEFVQDLAMTLQPAQVSVKLPILKVSYSTDLLTALPDLVWSMGNAQLAELEEAGVEEEHVELFTTPTTKMAAATSDFGYNLFRALVTRNAATNVFLAPSSISEALTQLSMGGSEQAQRQLYRALRYHSLQDPQFQNTLRDLLTSIKGPTKGLKTAARIYLARRLKVKPEFLTAVEKQYGTRPNSLKATNKDLRDINDWVKQQTANGVVRFLTKSLSAWPACTWLAWATLKIGQIQMEGDVSMFVFLPNDVTNNMTLVEESLTGEFVQDLAMTLQPAQVSVKLPVLKVSYSTDLLTALPDLGLSDWLRDTDLVGITAQPAKLLTVNHKVVMETAPEGIQYPSSSAYQSHLLFHVNRPFLYLRPTWQAFFSRWPTARVFASSPLWFVVVLLCCRFQPSPLRLSQLEGLSDWLRDTDLVGITAQPAKLLTVNHKVVMETAPEGIQYPSSSAYQSHLLFHVNRPFLYLTVSAGR
ncbi:hypothetical protein CRUP_020874 [Coryphaenoides rupestris]|nr:hypothetical protein CRUP_020874 [Coryphaenoides rupestris]